LNNQPRLRIVRLLQLLAIAYLLVMLAVLVFQRRLIYFPTRMPADVIESAAREHGFSPWRNAQGQIIGWRIPAGGTAGGSVLIFHGNAGCALGRDYLAQPIHAAARLDVFVLEYPGYGARPGSPTRKSIRAAAEEAFGLMPANRPKYLVSESIGTGVACELAGNHSSQVAGLALFVPYANLAWVAQKRMPLFPAYFLLLDRFNPAACLRAYRGPVQFVIAGADEILGPAAGKELYDRYDGPKRLTVVPGAGHNDVAGQSADWWKSVFNFWSSGRE
jgi:pimeloyl-ACP methyl ester carboxylesterase